MEKITISTARSLALFAQGLYLPPSPNAGKDQIKAAISRLGALQIDTINVVARSPYFSLWSRLGNYDPVGLDNLLEEGQIFEYWAHAASFLPIEDYPQHRRLMIEKQREMWFGGWYDDHKEESDAVLEHIRKNGPVRSADFERKDGRKSGWWDWKLEKRALEYWFAAGELMVSKRIKFQRVYDLRERVLPDWKDDDVPPLESVYHDLALKSIAAMGIAQPDWVADYFRLPKVEVRKVMDQLIRDRRLLEIRVEDWKDPCWALPEVWEDFSACLRKHPEPRRSTLLSPFDSLIWDRKRTSQLFGFDFVIECYLPAVKRKYGYFLLPILRHGNLIGRVDTKAHRADGVFEIKGLFLEESVQPNQHLVDELVPVLLSCAAWHQTENVMIRDHGSNQFLHNLQSALDQKTKTEEN